MNKRILVLAGSAAAAACVALGVTLEQHITHNPHAQLHAERTIMASVECGASCHAAYQVIGKALQHDHANVVSQAIINTRRFDYNQLANTLKIPTFADIQAQWRHHCNTAFPHNPGAASACYQLILGTQTNPLSTPAILQLLEA